MTEAIKSVIWRKGEDTINGKKVYKYLIGAILVTDQPITGINDNGDNVGMSQIPGGVNMFTEAFSAITKYKPPYNLGDLSDAMLSLGDMTPDDMITEEKETK